MHNLSFFSLALIIIPTLTADLQLMHMEVVPHGAITAEHLAVEEVVEVDEKELECMALNMYHEARNQPVAGQKAVGQVVLNRVASKKYPSTVCEVVWEVRTHYKTKRKTPMFSWTLDGKDDVPAEKELYKEITELATAMLRGDARMKLKNALLYHADYVKPRWSKSPKVERVETIGTHIFYAYKS